MQNLLEECRIRFALILFHAVSRSKTRQEIGQMSLIEDNRLLVLQPEWREPLLSDWVGRISLRRMLFAEFLTAGCRFGFPSALELDYTWNRLRWKSQLKSSGIVQNSILVHHPVVDAEIEVKANSSDSNFCLSSSVSTSYARFRLDADEARRQVGLYPKGPYGTEMMLEWPAAFGLSFGPPDKGCSIRVARSKVVDVGGRWTDGNADFCSIASFGSDGVRCWRFSLGVHLESFRLRLAFLVDSDKSVGISLKDSAKRYGLALWKLNKPSDSQRRRFPLGVSFFVEH
jgi:hypothetical protein